MNEGQSIEPFQVYARVRQILEKELQIPYNMKKKEFLQIEDNQVFILLSNITLLNKIQIVVQDPDNQDFFVILY